MRLGERLDAARLLDRHPPPRRVAPLPRRTVQVDTRRARTERANCLRHLGVGHVRAAALQPCVEVVHALDAPQQPRSARPGRAGRRSRCRNRRRHSSSSCSCRRSSSCRRRRHRRDRYGIVRGQARSPLSEFHDVQHVASNRSCAAVACAGIDAHGSAAASTVAAAATVPTVAAAAAASVATGAVITLPLLTTMTSTSASTAATHVPFSTDACELREHLAEDDASLAKTTQDDAAVVRGRRHPLLRPQVLPQGREQ
mmetsp:Transcript_38933/g.85573  ORF Transcript_38933/g.85573 Transcript_38933/m.85573 type:complete len:256 (+) Transcript_38933:697-1464(+)